MGRQLAFVRLSPDDVQVTQQRQTITRYAAQAQIAIDVWIEVADADQRRSRQRRINELRAGLHLGDTLLVAALEELGRSTGEVITLLDQLVASGIAVRIIGPDLHLVPQRDDAATQGLLALLALLARTEQVFTSARAKEALATKKAQGTTLGKPKGTIQVSMYDQDRERIATLLRLGVSQRRIVEQHLGYGTANSLRHYIRTRGLSTDAA
ncbi:MAG: recombinase family protein [Caldilineaceae bacterium]|nr:recombinase family protein [Caldilineaceae bacterium]